MSSQAFNKWYGACFRKRKYRTRDRADKALEAGQASGHYSPTHHVYHCPHCLDYHIGRKNK